MKTLTSILVIGLLFSFALVLLLLNVIGRETAKPVSVEQPKVEVKIPAQIWCEEHQDECKG